MTRGAIYLTRHGETEWNAQGRFQGRADSPLTERGLLQARSLAQALGPVRLDAVYASPSERTMRTAKIVRGQRGIPIIAAPPLLEIDVGAWEGLTKAEADRDYPLARRVYEEDPAAYEPPLGGETFHDVRRRVLGFWQEMLQAAPGRSVLLVTHTVPLKLLLSEIEGRPLRRLWQEPFIAQASLSEIEVDGERCRIRRYADAAHLPKEP